MQEANVNYVKYLIDLAQQGKKNSFLELCEINLKPIYTLAARTLVDKGVADEVVRRVFVSAWRNIKFFHDDLSITSWLRSITVFEVLEEIRTRNCKKKAYSKAGAQIIDPVETESEIEKLILDLPELERVIFVLHDIEGYNTREISGFFGDFSLSEVRNILKLARQKLTGQS